MRSDLFSIGEFSRVSKMSVKTLRFYDERGLLKPGHIDSRSGYRYYSSVQLNEANLIRLLRSLELPLDEIQLFLRESDPERQQALLAGHKQHLERKLEGYQSIISSIERLVEATEGDLRRKVDIRELADQCILGVRGNTPLDDIDTFFGTAFTGIFSYLGEIGEHPAGPPFALYFDEEFDESDVDLELCIPVIRPLGGRDEIQGRELPGGIAASTMHMGPYHEIAEAYQTLDLWMKDNGYVYSGPPREIYLVGPDQVEDMADLRTEILFPIRDADK